MGRQFLLRPTVGAVLVGAHVVQSHLLFGATSLRLEEDRLPMGALGTSVVFGARQRGIGDHVGHNVGQFVDLVHNLVHVDAVGVRLLFVIAIPAGVQQDLVLLVLLGVQHVVALLAEPNAHESRPLSVCGIKGSRHGYWLTIIAS